MSGRDALVGLYPLGQAPGEHSAKELGLVALLVIFWLLLLQVSIADLTQLDTEGTVYFMVHKEDFAKRDFSRVVASYQQT